MNVNLETKNGLVCFSNTEWIEVYWFACVFGWEQMGTLPCIREDHNYTYSECSEDLIEGYFNYVGQVVVDSDARNLGIALQKAWWLAYEIERERLSVDQELTLIESRIYWPAIKIIEYMAKIDNFIPQEASLDSENESDRHTACKFVAVVLRALCGDWGIKVYNFADAAMAGRFRITKERGEI